MAKDDLTAVADAVGVLNDPRPFPVPANGPVPQMTLTAPTPPKTPWYAPQNIALIISTVLSVLGYILHKDLSNLAGPIATAATAILAAAIAVMHGVKYAAYQRAVSYMNEHRFQVWAKMHGTPDTQQILSTMANYFSTLDARVASMVASPAVVNTTAKKQPARPKAVTAATAPRRRRS